MLSALSGCVSAPGESVELADVVMEQSTALEASHRALVEAYFDGLEDQVDDFVDRVWTPDFLARAVANPDVVAAVDRVRAGVDIDASAVRSAIEASGRFSAVETGIVLDALDQAQLGYRAQFGQVMLDFSDAAAKQINKARSEFKAPLREKRRELQRALDEGYTNLHAGQATLKAYLESVVDVVAAQDEVLRKLGAIDERNKAMDAIIKASEKATDLAPKLDKLTGRIDREED